MQKKRMVAGALGCLIACSHPAGHVAAAAMPQIHTIKEISDSGKRPGSGEITDSEEITGSGEDAGKESLALQKRPEDLAPDYNDPDYVKQLIQQENDAQQKKDEPFSLKSVSEKTTRSPYTGLVYTHAARLSDSEIVHGIDVSKWQAEINWKKVKAAGVKFVFIRCGYTALADKFAMYEDEYFRKNIEGAYNAGIQVGIYFFSNSITTSEAEKEAEKTLELIEDYRDMITLPVVYDFEAFSIAYRAYGLPKEQVTKNMLTYASLIQTAGFTPMYYGSPNFLDSSFNVSKLTDYDCWLANYTTKSVYTGDYIYWQYSSTGQVDGISGNVDCNFYYEPQDEDFTDQDDIMEELGPVTGLAMLENATNAITIHWDQLAEADGYKIYRSKSLGGDYRQIRVINSNEVTEYTDAGVMESEGRQYYYKIVPFVMDEDANMRYGRESDILTAHTERLHAFRLKTTNSINLREQAGTEYDSMAVIPAGTGLPFYKFTLSTKDAKWYKVTYAKNGRNYTGYLSGNYVTIYTYGNTTKKVNMRPGAGLTYKIQRSVPKGTKVTIMKNKTDKTGTKWSQIKYSMKGKTYSGFIPAKYIRQI